MGVPLLHRCGKGYLNITSPKHKEKLNELGKEGWELVSVVFDQTGKVQKLYFKRQIK